eukprot:scaffold110802_cov36-Attheya_sp.AAC.1
MGNEKEIVLSVEETNALRLELGLAPLRFSGAGEGTSRHGNSDGLHNVGDKEQLSLSVQDTNVLRAQLGLKPLSVPSIRSQSADNNNRPAEDDAIMGRKASEAIHAPASNTGVEKETRERIETARLKREIEQRLQTMQQTVDDEDAHDTTGGTALSWAEKMRTASTKTHGKKKKKKKGTIIDSRNRMSIPSHEEEEEAKEYGEKELDDLAVAHSAADFELGHTTILTLADADVTKYDDDSNVLENVNMRDHQLQKDHLREKRMVEMGMGHAGGYAGYDDDEFEELGGTSDFMTAEEKDTEEQERREKKRQKKLFKKMKKDKKRKEKRTHRRRKNDNDSDDDDNDKESDSDQDDGGGNKTTDIMATDGQQSGNLLDDLENTAVGKQAVTKPRKRRRYDDDDDDDAMEDSNTVAVSQTSTKPADTDIKAGSQGEENGKGKDDFGDAALEKKRAKFDKIMEKGNARTDAVFGSKVNTGGARKNTVQKTESKNANIGNNDEEEEEEDDAFLNAALAKARRLQRLRELNAKSNAGVSGDNDSKLEPSHQKKPKGAEAVVQAMQAMQNMSDTNKSKESQPPKKGITFEFDETREFTRALRARAEQVERLNARKKQLAAGVAISTAKKSNLSEEEKRGKRQQEVEVEDVTMEELAAEVSQTNNDEDDDQVEQDDSGGGFDAPIGRGMSNVLSMLRHTGEITGKKAGKEELRGRAKDKRTYEDYAALDLKKVVKIDRSNPGINERDLEFANREIKLEYRDEHGRLLTRHEAFRQMSYQFHGHGSSKKNEERRMRQIEREHAEGTLASRMDGSGRNGEGKGTLGALKATQRATGKAFVVHKT